MVQEKSYKQNKIMTTNVKFSSFKKSLKTPSWIHISHHVVEWGIHIRMDLKFNNILAVEKKI